MKKMLSKFLSFLLAIAVFTGFADWPGTGMQISAEEPENTVSLEEDAEDFIPVYTIEDLYNIRNDLDANYRLMNDIDLTEATAEGGDWNFMGNGWNPIGSNDVYGGGTFNGIFDGGGHSIIGMRIEITNCPTDVGNSIYLGLFSKVSGKIHDLHMTNNVITIKIQFKGNVNIGAIAGYNLGTIEESSSSGNIDVSVHGTYNNDINIYTGGIVGYCTNSIVNCYNTGSIFSKADYSFAGGIAGHGNNIIGCYNTGNVSSDASWHSYAGGMSGKSENIIIDNCHNTGEIYSISSNFSSYAGGMTGNTVSSCISKCDNKGSIIARSAGSGSYSAYAGGIVGYTENNDITKCSNTGEVAYQSGYTTSYVGGIAGKSSNDNISNCGNEGNISFYLQLFCSSSYAGGIVGHNNSKITNSYNTGQIDANASELSYAGGMAGYSGYYILACYNSGSIDSSADTAYSGGIAGKIDGFCGSITNSYNTGRINSKAFSYKDSAYSGGIAGDSGSVTNCYSIGVTDEAWLMWSSGTFGNRKYGSGIAPRNVKNSYYLANTGTGAGCLTAEQMYLESVYEGFDFDKIWIIQPSSGYLYPQLRDNAQYHDFGDWQTRTPATCTEKGEEYRACVCGEEETREIQPLQHSFTKYVSDNNATCTENCTETAKCDRCDATDTREIEDSALGHDYSEEWSIDREPTCTEPGSKSHYCTRCDAKTDITEIPADGHSFGQWILERPATMTEDGLKVRVCSICHAREENILPAGECIPGDVTKDERVTIRDVSAIRLFLAGDLALTEMQQAAGDINQDGRVTIRDLSAIRLFLAGKYTLERSDQSLA